MSFLTLEDINTTIYNHQECFWHDIDTSIISDSDDGDYEVFYDFCKVKRTKVSDGYDFMVQIHADNWTHGWRCHHPVIRTDIDLEENKIYFNSSTPVLECGLYMGTQTVSHIYSMDYVLEYDKVSLNMKELQEAQTIRYRYYFLDEWDHSISSVLDAGYNILDDGHNQTLGVVFVNLLKTDFRFNCNQTLTIGKKNKVQLGTNTDYKPNGDMIGTYNPKITVTYEGEELEVTYDSTLQDYCFELDLTNKTNSGKVSFNVYVEQNKVINRTNTRVILDCDYETITTYVGLLSNCGTGGADIIKLGANITLTDDIPIKHSIKIIGGDKTINLNEHSIKLDESVTFLAENINFNNGDTTIIQQNNTIVELTNCTFTNCTSTNYNGLGSCIYCDNNIEDLDNPTDYETTLTNCTFTNNHNAILHGGTLIITGCKLHNNTYSSGFEKTPSLLYQTDGSAIIRDSIFDIDYTTNNLCTGEINLGYGQCLIMCGETAFINGKTHDDLKDNNTLPFFNSQYNNRCHVFAKYYYPQIEACVYISPLTGFEDKSCCHAVSGVDWIFKNNAQVTRASWNTQNETRTITWEE